MEKSVVIARLASSLERRDEVPNQELAKEIIESNDTGTIEVLVDCLNEKDQSIQNDCIKVLYEVGESKPELISNHLDDFLILLNHKNNRLQWGAMTAIHYISRIKPSEIYPHLPKILDAAEKGSVISKDQAVNILVQLATFSSLRENVLSLLLEQLKKSAINQLPMYAEKSLPVISDNQKQAFKAALQSRLLDVEKESKRKRILKVIQKLD